MPAGVKEAIARFYALNDSDDRSASVSEELASSIFTRDAECIVNKLVMKGKDDISKFDRGGDSISRLRHEVHKVWALKESGDDLLLTGMARMELKDGKRAETNTAARFVIGDTSGSPPKIKLLQGWVDFVPFLEIGFGLPSTEQIKEARKPEDVYKST